MKLAWFHSLRGRLLGLLLLVFVPAALHMAITHLQHRRFLEAESEQTVRRIVRLTLQKEEAVAGAAQVLVASMARADSGIRRNRARCERYLSELMRDQGIYRNLGFVDARGDLLCSAAPAAGKLNFADRSWFIQARDGKRFSVSEFVISRITGDRVVVFGYPTASPEGRFDGAVFAVADLSWLEDMITALQLPAGTMTEVVDGAGALLARYPPAAEGAGEGIASSPVVLQALRSRPVPEYVQAPGADGAMRLYGVVPLAVATRNAFVLVSLPSTAGSSMVDRAFRENLLWLLALGIIAAAGVWLVVDRMVLRNVRQLVGFSGRLADGEFGARNDTDRGIREFDELSDAFDRLATGLERREDERLRALEALRTSEERFRSIAELSSVGIYRTDAIGRCIYVNRQWCSIAGMAPEQALGDGWLNVLHPHDKARVSRNWEQAVSRRERFRDEFRFVRPDGAETWVMGEALPENERQGGFVGTMTDISERMQAEMKLRTSEERFRAFMSTNPAACWIVDEHGRFAYMNRALAEMLDSTEAALAGQSLFDLFPRELAQDYDEKNRLVLREGRVLECVERAPRRDGSLGDFATFRFPLRDTNGRDVIGGMAFDVTERTRMADALKSSEERFREFMDNNPALCWISDESGRVTYVNKTYVKSLKLSLDPVGRHPIELFPTAIARSHLYGVKAALDKNKPLETQEQLLRSDGSNGDFTVFRFPLVTTEGRRSVGGVAIDITERLRAAGELREANVRLQALSNRIIEVQETERRQLARELHDEIGQCLTALKINLEGLQRTASEPAVLKRVAESVDLSAHTLAQVRRLSVDLRPSQLDDLGLEPALRSILERQATTGGFTGHYQSRLEGVELTDQVETACFRVCQEALTNIIKHAQAQNVWVTVETEGNRLNLRVRDDGKGFDPVNGSKRAVAGESFGLLGMQERASLAGGHLEIASAPGQGAEVRAWFSIRSATTDGRS